MDDRPSRTVRLVIAGLCLVLAPCWVRAQEAAPTPAPEQAPPEPAPPPAAPQEPLPGPPEIPTIEAGRIRTLPTHPVRRGEISPNERLVSAEVLPRDPSGIWVLDFSYKPVRLRTVELPGKGRKRVHYLYYRVINNTGAPRMFVPQFTLVTDTGRRYEDAVIPQAVELIRAREGADIPVLGAVDVIGMIPPSGDQEGIDQAVYGVAVWEEIDPAADKFSIYIRGLSDGNQTIVPPAGGEPQVMHKTLRLDFLRPGDERNLSEREIRPADPANDWVYW